METKPSAFLTCQVNHGEMSKSEVALIKTQLSQLQETVDVMEKRLNRLEKGASSMDSEPTFTDTLPTYSEQAFISPLPSAVLNNGHLSFSNPFDSSLENDELWKLTLAVCSLLACIGPYVMLTPLCLACRTSCPKIRIRVQDI